MNQSEQKLLKQFLEKLRKVYGKANFHEAYDIALKGEYVNRKIVCRLSDDLNEEYPLPYFFDVVNYNDISNEELKKHIDNVGKTIYKRED